MDVEAGVAGTLAVDRTPRHDMVALSRHELASRIEENDLATLAARGVAVWSDSAVLVATTLEAEPVGRIRNEDAANPSRLADGALPLCLDRDRTVGRRARATGQHERHQQQDERRNLPRST